MLAAGMALLWWTRSSMDKTTRTAGPIANLPSLTREALKPVDHEPVAPGEVATTKELAKAWSARHFLFRNPLSSDLIPAIAVRLPNGQMWGVALREPFGTCELEYVSDLQKLKRDYHFAASHPMIVDPCGGTVFDLAIYGNAPSGLVRGEIVAGSGIRPPLAIQIETRGNQVYATRME